MYTFESRVRYSETDHTGHLTLQGILDYFQDSSTFHSEELGIGIDYLNENEMLWVLSAWQIVVERYPKMGEEIKVVTFPYDFKGFLGYRNFYIEDKAGNKAAYANSIWTLMDLKEGRPAKPPTEMIEKYILSDKLPMDYASRKIEFSGRGAQKEAIEVKEHHLDSNMHVNNGQYIRMALDSVGEEKHFRQMRATYKKSAVLHNIIIPFVQKEKDKYIIELCDTEGEVFSVVELNR